MSKTPSKPMPAKPILIARAVEAVDFLMSYGADEGGSGFWPGTKRAFAEAMSKHYGPWWLKIDGRAGDADRVLAVCNVTRDQHLDPRAKDALSGYMVDYSNNQGGMVLVETKELTVPQQHHILRGMIARQQFQKTVNRRQTAFLQTAADNAFLNGDMELGSVFLKADAQIDSIGMIADELLEELSRLLNARGAGS